MPTGLRAMPMLSVTDVEASADALARGFGFEAAGFWRGDDGAAQFSILRLGLVTLGLRRVEAVAPAPGWAAYVYVDDVEAIADLGRAGGFAVSGPEARPYGTREVEVTDRDGNVICFALDLRPGADGPGL
ncbi:VOC family protein [Oceanicella sp. SM1341]|uniref:VOC family protein n=1 Tax=Oceanicella sp. SM1341 TaxID=1548889 RepID=UPI000E4F13B1|nr:VOC family protein [Oceanicella sp. SM1341]